MKQKPINVDDGQQSDSDDNAYNDEDDDPENMDRKLMNDHHILKHAEIDRKMKEDKRRR